MKVIGIGERKTLAALISACDKFIYLEILRKQPEETPVATPAARPKRANKKTSVPGSVPAETPQPQQDVVSENIPEPTATIKTVDRGVVELISTSINDVADEAGWAFLGDLGNLLLKKQPDFDPRNYGFKKLVPMIKSLNEFEIDERETGKGNIKHVFVRIKP